MAINAVELEIDADNANLHFRPLMRSVRGKFDFSRMGEPLARVKGAEWPVIPSQRIGITPDGVGYLIEPIHAPEHAALKEKIERAGMKLEPAMQEFEGIDQPSWLWWLRNAVQAGCARVVSGKLTDQINGPVRKNFILSEPPMSAADKVNAALENQTVAFNRLTDAILKMVEVKAK